MPIPQRLTQYLEANGIDHRVLDHPLAMTAQDMAQATHIHGRDVAKAVIIRDGSDYHMILVPADCIVDLAMVAREMNLDHPEIASESEVADLFPDCETGAMPVFGNLYGLPTVIDDHLVPEKDIAFHAGNHHQSIRMHTRDFMQLVKPRVVHVGVHV